jgi:hypothetical protein
MVSKQFVNGQEIEIEFSKFRDLRFNQNYDRFEVGHISIKTQNITLSDPLSLSRLYPLKRKVDIGEYPLSLYFTQTKSQFGYRVAYAVLQFQQAVPDNFEFALISENLLDDDLDKTINGMFPVDAGLFAISDTADFNEYASFYQDFFSNNEDGNFYNDVLEELFKQNGDIPQGASPDGDWLSFTVPQTDVCKVIMFSSGLGDGLYPAYFGTKNDGTLVSLVVDFLTLDRVAKLKPK